MKRTPALFSYRNGTSLLHRSQAWLKLIFLIIITLRTFSNSNYGIPATATVVPYLCWIRTGFYFIVAITLFLLAKTPFSSLLRLKFILWLGLFIASLSLLTLTSSKQDGKIIFSINLESFYLDLLYICRFFVTAIISLVIFETTSRLEILAALTTLENAVSKIIPPFRKLKIALLLSITITFIPEVFSCWNKVTMAAASRTPLNKKGKRRFSIRSFYEQFVAFFLNMLQYAEEVRRAVCNRSY